MLEKIKQVRLNKNSKMATSLIILLALIVSPVLFTKDTPVKEVVKAVENIPTPSPTPTESKTPESTPTPEPAKTKAPKTPAPIKKQTQAPAQSNTSKTNQTAKAPTRSQNNATSQNALNQPSALSPAPQPAVSGILGYINQVRAENGLVQLTYNGQLNSAAKAKSQDMLSQNYFSHTSPDGRSDFDFIKAAGYAYRYAGSNIAKGSFTERSVFDAWMNSSGHRANILDARAREFGYGVAGSYFTMMVGAR